MTWIAFLHHMAFCALLSLLSAAIVGGMIRLRLMDLPSLRKAHSRPTPKGGGVGIVVAFMAGIAALYEFAAFSRLAEPYFRGIVLASAAIAVVALLDDVRDWPFTVKLGAQLAAAMTAVASGLYVSDYRLPFIGPVEIGWLAPLATLAWILFTTNAVNFIDGLDGLAAGVSLISCGFLAEIAASQSSFFTYFAAMLLGAGLVGFLPFNFPRARIFMGDVGSQFCGFVLAMLGVAASRFESVEMSFVLVPILLSGVLFDVAFTLARRTIAGEALTSPHRGHLYQVAHRAGMDARAVTMAHWSFAAFGGICCLAFVRAPSALKPIFLLVPFGPQIAWFSYVRMRARKANLGRW